MQKQELQLVSKQELANLSVKQKMITKFTGEDRQIAQIKYQSKPIKSMTYPELNVSANELLIKIHVITGWAIPANEIMLLFVDQFKKKLVESYQYVNVDEFEYAFRHNFVKDWGKSMNLSLIDEVMSEYLAKRREISKVEETQPPLELPAPKFTEAEAFEWLAEIKESYLKGELRRQFLPEFLYDYLEGKKLIVKTKWELWELAKVNRIKELEKELIQNFNKETVDALRDIKDDKLTKKHKEYTKIVVEARKIAIIEYLKN